jgi:hypothetical protein
MSLTLSSCRIGETGRQLRDGKESGHQNCQQGETQRIRSDEGLFSWIGKIYILSMIE